MYICICIYKYRWYVSGMFCVNTRFSRIFVAAKHPLEIFNLTKLCFPTKQVNQQFNFKNKVNKLQQVKKKQSSSRTHGSRVIN